LEESKLILGIEDLFLLEGFQIVQVTRISIQKELAAILHAHPKILPFLIHKNPSISPFISKVMKDYGPADDPKQLDRYSKLVVKVFEAELSQKSLLI